MNHYLSFNLISIVRPYVSSLTSLNLSLNILLNILRIIGSKNELRSLKYKA